VWVDFRSSQKNIYSSQLAVGGATWAANLKVTNDSAADKDFPDVVVGGDGTAYAVWQDSRNGNADIYYAKLPPGGNTWTTPNVKVSDDPGTTAQTSPRLGIDASGNLIAVWLDARTSPAQIRMSRLASGTAIWSASTAVTSGADRPLSVALAVRTDGKAYLAFHDNRSGNNDVYVREYDPWLNQWGVSTLASDDAGSAAQQSPTVAYTSTEVMLGWRDDRSGNADVRARRAALAGGVDHFGYTYDGLNRLTAESGALAETFVIDGASNLSSRTGPSATYTYDTSNRLTGDGGAQPYVWNNADRLASHGSDSFTYDPLGRLTSSTTASTTRDYTYNGDGLMATRTQGGNTTTFAWDQASSAAHLLQTGSDRIVYAIGPLYAVKSDNSTSTFARDASANVRAEVGTGGSVTGSYRYRTYGELAQSSGSGPTYFGYGMLLPDSSGLLYARARWYNPAVGRFLSHDPLLGEPTTPNSLNGYNYANANPLNWGDPSGLDPSRHDLNSQLNQRLAYAIAGVFVDLDSPDPATRARAYLKVGGAGVVTAVGVVVIGHIGLETLTASSGEGMAATQDAAMRDAAFQAARAARTFDVSSKHLWWAGGNAGKFAAGVDIQAAIEAGLRSAAARFLSNPQLPGSFRVVTDLGVPVGTKGQTVIRTIVTFGGDIITSFPVRFR
jgi:RHS repeat-associated protein